MSLSDFKNEPVLELRRASERARLTDALSQLERQLPITVPVIVGAAVDLRLETLSSFDPSRPQRLVATAAEADSNDIDLAVSAATEASAELASCSGRGARRDPDPCRR